MIQYIKPIRKPVLNPACPKIFVLIISLTFCIQCPLTSDWTYVGSRPGAVDAWLDLATSLLYLFDFDRNFCLLGLGLLSLSLLVNPVVKPSTVTTTQVRLSLLFSATNSLTGRSRERRTACGEQKWWCSPRTRPWGCREPWYQSCSRRPSSRTSS